MNGTTLAVRDKNIAGLTIETFEPFITRAGRLGVATTLNLASRRWKKSVLMWKARMRGVSPPLRLVVY